MKEPLKRRALKWMIKKLVFSLDKDDDLLAYSFSGGERKDYTISVDRFYDDGSYSIGTMMFPRNDVCVRECKKEEGETCILM